MSRMFTPEPELSGAPNAEIPESPAPIPVEPEGPEEFEFVLGRRQIASVSLVVLTIIGACTVGAYVAGKSVGKVVTVEAAAPKATAPTPAPVPAVATRAAVSAEILDAPLGAAPEQGKTYIQLASVDRGFATLMAHGARKLGFPAFVAPGANEKVYRVLSGPFQNSEELEKAKTTFAAAGLETFVRKIQAAEPAPKTDVSVPEQP